MTRPIFLGGLPRSGSTLLTNILGQHPDISVSSTSGLSYIVQEARRAYSTSDEIKASIKDLDSSMQNLVKGMIDGWAFSDNKVYIDKGRGWLPLAPILHRIYGDSFKLIVPIRDLRGIFASMEKLYRNKDISINPIVNQSKNGGITREDRFNGWASSVPVGPSIGNIKDTLDRGFYDGLIFIRMEDLINKPNETISELYKEIGVPNIPIKYPIEEIVSENDKIYNIKGLHDLKSIDTILPIEEDYEEILGEYICNDILEGYSWFYSKFYK